MNSKTSLFCATVLMLSFHTSARASSLLVSYSTAGGQGGMFSFPLTPQSTGNLFDTESAQVTSVTVANNSAYWATSTQVFTDSLLDSTGGGGKTMLPGVPFAGFTISDLAIDPLTNAYLVGWIAPGFGWFVAQYPPGAGNSFTVFVNATAPVQGLTISGNNAYWIEGTNVWSQHLDGTGKTQVQNFTSGDVSLSDFALDPPSQTYLLGATASGLPPLIARYPLTPNASGTLFSFSTSSVTALTIASNRAYWIDGQNVWSQSLNETDLTLQETLPLVFTPTDLAVALDTPAGVPEPAAPTVLAGGLLLMFVAKRRR